MSPFVWLSIGLIVVAVLISTPLTWLMIRLGRRLGALDSAGAAGHAKVLRDVPNTGGVAIFAGLAVPLALGLLALLLVPTAQWERWLPAVVEHLPRARSSALAGWALLACLAALHVVGVVDDRRSLGPWVKLLVQALAAAVMTIFFEVRLLDLLGPAPSIALTIVWIIVVTNAINFMDNMDGLAAGTSAIAALLFMIACLVNAQWFVAATLALLVGALIGFLIFNFPPARIFMGDGGSLVIGFLLAVLIARTTFFDPEVEFGLGSAWYGVFMPLAVLAIPLYDFVTVTFIRLKQGRSPFVGDQQHFSHRIVQRGVSTRSAVIIIWGATAITGIGGIALGSLQPWQAVLVAIQTVLVLMVIALVEHASRNVRP